MEVYRNAFLYKAFRVQGGLQCLISKEGLIVRVSKAGGLACEKRGWRQFG